METIVIIVTLMTIVLFAVSSIMVKMRYGKIKENLTNIAKPQGFSRLNKSEKNILIDILSANFILGGDLFDKLDIIEGFVKKSGDADMFLSFISRHYFENETKDRSLVHDTLYLNFYGLVENDFPNALIIHGKDKPITIPYTGDVLKVNKSLREFDLSFYVRSIDTTIKNTDIPVEIQEAILRFNTEYPLNYLGVENFSYVFINKKGVSITAPKTDSEKDMMSLFELGAEITEILKQRSE